MDSFETDFRDMTATEEIDDMDDTIDFEEYEKELQEKTKQEQLHSKKNKKQLKQKLILNSIIPLFIAFIAVVVAGNLISNEIIKDQSDLIELRVDKTTIGFLKHIGKSMTETLMKPLTLQLSLLQKLKSIILQAEGRDGFRFLEADTGRYDRFFKRNVDNNKVKIRCFSALELVGNEVERKKMQRCLLINDLYSTVKFWDWGRDAFVKEYIRKYPTVIIGLERGHSKNIFHNMTKENELKKLREMHPDLIYDLAIAQTLAPYIVDEQFSSGILKYVGFWESSLVIFSQNDIDIKKRKNETGYGGRIPCTDFGYPNNFAAGYDPRCRTWMKFAQSLLESFQKRYGYNFGDFEKKVPAYVSPLYTSLFSEEITEITVCSPQTRIKQDGSPPSLYFVVCQDIELTFLKQTLSRNLLYYYFSLFGDDDVNNTFQNPEVMEEIRKLRKRIVKEDMINKGQIKKTDGDKGLDLSNEKLIKLLTSSSFLKGIEYLRDILGMGGANYLGYIVIIRQNYINPLSGFQKLLYSWENEQARIEKLTKRTDPEKRYLKMAKILGGAADAYLKKWDESIEKYCGGVEDSLALPLKCNDALINFDLNNGGIEVEDIADPNKKTSISITFGEGLYKSALDSEEFETATILKIGIIFPSELIKTKNLRYMVSVLLTKLTFYQILSMTIVLLFGCLILRQTSYRISDSMDRLVNIFKRIEEGERAEEKEDQFVSECKEVSEVYSSFILLKKSFDEAFDAFKSGNQTESLLKYSMALSLYKRVNNYQLAGIICNNIGNIHLNSGKIDEAIRMYEQAIKYGEKAQMKNQNSVVTRRMNLAVALREKSLIEEQDVKGMTNKERMQRKATLMKMEKIVTELFRFFKEEDDSYHSTIYACMLCYIYLQINNFRLSRIFEKNAQIGFEGFKQEKKLWREKKRFESFELNKVFLAQEIMLIQAETSYRRGEMKQAADILTLCIKKGTKFSFSIRKRIIIGLEKIFNYSNLRLTKNFTDLRKRIKIDKEAASRNFIFLMDYSSSMANGNKLVNSIKAFLTIWDEHILENDNVAFIRYNLNPEVVFGLERKKVNEFSKRHQIEMSLFPKDRTALFDAIYKGIKMSKKRKFRKNNTTMIVILDGGDVNSVIEKRELYRKLNESSNLMLICVGLGLERDVKESIKELVKNSMEGQLVEPNGNDFDILFQMLSSYVNQNNGTEFFGENL